MGFYCEMCRRKHMADTDCRFGKTAQRVSPRKRGYDSEWDIFRRRYFTEEENHCCHDCDQRIIIMVQDKRYREYPKSTKIGAELHHIVKLEARPELRLEPDNVLGLCSRCHKKRTDQGE